jgi:hypothetical protein
MIAVNGNSAKDRREKHLILSIIHQFDGVSIGAAGNPPSVSILISTGGLP